jgi:hypothetical protein
VSEELARIKEVGFGNRDVGSPVLFFTAELEGGTCALQVLSAKEAVDVIQRSGVYSVDQLNGMFCWVETNHHSAVFSRLWGEESS